MTLGYSLRDQTHISHVMAYSACIKPYRDDPVRCPSKAFTVLQINDTNFIPDTRLPSLEVLLQFLDYPRFT